MTPEGGSGLLDQLSAWPADVAACVGVVQPDGKEGWEDGPENCINLHTVTPAMTPRERDRTREQ